MKFALTLFLFLNTFAFAMDVGDGSDGSCDVLGTATTQITAAKKYYQCTTLNINGNLSSFKGGQPGAGGVPLFIKVLGSVTISSGTTLDLSGANGIAGSATAASGGSAGTGGSAGGSSLVGANGLNGNGSGGGIGGSNVISNPAGTTSYGGGGGGGSYKTKSATVAVDGFNSAGAAPGSGGANGNNFLLSESQFDTSFVGGSGGAAGGGAFTTALVSGSSGGGGGGAIRIVAGGNVQIDGTIISNGGNGGGVGAPTPTPSSGGGGGASGGAIWFQAAGTLTVSATGVISAIGGVGGTNDFSISGGNGGNGGIRLDSGNGTITNLGSITPAPYSTTFVPTISSATSASRQYASSISCAKVSIEDDQNKNLLLNFLFGLIISGTGYLVFSRNKKV